MENRKNAGASREEDEQQQQAETGPEDSLPKELVAEHAAACLSKLRMQLRLWGPVGRKSNRGVATMVPPCDLGEGGKAGGARGSERVGTMLLSRR